jgi:hypothetical protein
VFFNQPIIMATKITVSQPKGKKRYSLAKEIVGQESTTRITPGFATLSPAYEIVFLAWRDLACKIATWIN